MEPVREWLKSLPKEERKIIGEDIKTTQGMWPWSKPLVGYLGNGIWEVRSSLKNSISRVVFFLEGGEMILLHGFKKKRQQTSKNDLELSNKRKKQYESQNQ